ncbi:MAG: D-allose transporter substrate-binding protein [Azospirillaceae bacterium]|nr:D-allose transporter substrate-binding protein [Azospirillaceae bacterium]
MSVKKTMMAAMFGAALAAAPATVMAADYAVVLKTLANPFWVNMKDGIEAEAKKLGVEVDIVSSPSEGDLQAQLQLFEDLLNKPYKGIAFAPISANNLIQPIAKAYKKGMFLVNIDEKVDMEGLKQAGANVEAFITTNNVAVGKKGADFIINKLGAAGGQVAIIEGKAGTASGEARKNGASGAFKAAANIELVASQPADWDRLRALDVATNTLQTSPALKAIYCANDTMALGAMQAVQNAGKGGKVMVVGTDGDPEALAMIKAGRMTATVAQDPAKIGATGLDLLVEAVKNGKQTAVGAVPKLVLIDSILVTKE